MEEENRQKRLTNKYLYERQMNHAENTLREHGAISEQQYLFSTEELTRKIESGYS